MTAIMEINGEKMKLKNEEQKLTGSGFMQCADCAAPFILRILSTMKGAAVIIHSPNGCTASFADFNRKFVRGLRNRGLPPENIPLMGTGLDERDMICGFDEKLEAAIEEAARRYAPKAIFVAASCGSGLTGYEIQQVTGSLQARFSIPLIAVVCEIYGLKKWSSGFDPDRNGFIRRLAKPLKGNDQFYNVIDFSGSDTIKRLLEQSGICWNFISCFQDYECLEKMTHAMGTFRITSDRFSSYLAGSLEKEFGIPNIEIPSPCGFLDTDSCLRSIGRIVGRQKEFSKIAECQHERYEARLGNIIETLKGVRILPVAMGKLSIKTMGSMLEELGMVVLEVKAGRKSTRGGPPDIRQGYELLPMVRSARPDIIIARHYSFTSWGIRLGIPTLWLEEDYEFFGYEGLVRLGQRLADIISNSSFANAMKRHTILPYTDQWMEPGCVQGG